jgi:hypothetical protein
MKLDPVNIDSTLFSVTDVFPDTIVDQLNSLNWSVLPRRSDDVLHRSIVSLPGSLEEEIRQHAVDVVFPTVEQIKNIRFDRINNFSLNVWMNHPGYLSGVHVDGQIPATMQIFLEPAAQPNWGINFYKSKDTADVLHYFPSIPNSGYIALAKTSQYPLWHGTVNALPHNVLRISLIFILNNYTVL